MDTSEIVSAELPRIKTVEYMASIAPVVQAETKQPEPVSARAAGLPRWPAG